MRPQTAATLAVHGNSWQFIYASDSSGGTGKIGKGVPMAHKIHKVPAQELKRMQDRVSELGTQWGTFRTSLGPLGVAHGIPY